MTDPIAAIFAAFDEGQAALLVTGRSLHDLVVDEGRIRPAVETLRRECRRRHGMHLVSYSMASGLDWDASRIDDERDRRTIEQALRAHHLLDVPQDANEVVRVIRGIASLSRTPAENMAWTAGEPLRFAFLLDFSEHLAPGSLSNGTQTDTQLVAIELAHLTAQSLALRGSGNLLVFHGRDGLMDELAASVLYRVSLPQPDSEEKLRFLEVAGTVYPKAGFDSGLLPEQVAHLTTNTPNRGLESLLRASHRTGRRLTARELSAQKSRDVESLSDRTLTVLDPARIAGVRLFGANTDAPLTMLLKLASALRRGDTSMPANVLLVGPPGTGKTDLALMTAREAGVAAYEMHSPKRAYVGQTEMLAPRQQSLLKEWRPNIAFTDEITESLPMERSEFDGDSGATRAVMGTLLTALSDETRRGRSLLIATTNTPWRMSAAMRSRFTMLPVLYPLREDLPAIVAATAARVLGSGAFDANDEQIIAASELFHEKGASPRHILAALSNALLIHGQLTPDTVYFAADDLCGADDRVSTVYADLWAVRCCSSRTFLPWSAAPSSYPFPEHLTDLVNHTTGGLDETALDKRLAELRPHANV